MAALGEDFLICDDLDVILSLIEEDVLVEDEGFTAEVEEKVALPGENQPTNSFSCDQ